MTEATAGPETATSRGRGHPTHYKPEYCEQAKKLCALGATDAGRAYFFEVDRKTIHNWQTAHPEFREALQLGKKAADDRVVRTLHERACGYEYEAQKVFQYEGKPVYAPYTEHVPAD